VPKACLTLLLSGWLATCAWALPWEPQEITPLSLKLAAHALVYRAPYSPGEESEQGRALDCSQTLYDWDSQQARFVQQDG